MNTSHHDRKRGDTSLILQILPWLAILVVLQIAYGVVARTKLGLSDASNFGEMFGALEVFFSGLGFIGVILTIRMQGRDAVDAQDRQTRQIFLLEEQLELLRAEIEMQRKRDEIEAGPFFRLVGAEYTNNLLKLSIANLGAPIICLDLTAATPSARVQRWSPDSLAAGDSLQFEVQLPDAQERRHAFNLLFRDRRGQQRTYRLAIDRQTNPAKFTFAPAADS